MFSTTFSESKVRDGVPTIEKTTICGFHIVLSELSIGGNESVINVMISMSETYLESFDTFWLFFTK